VGEGGDAVPPLGSDAAAGRAGTGAAADQGSGRRILAIGAAGLSLAALGLGIVQHVSWQDKVASFDGMPQCGASLPARGGGTCTELYDDGQRARLIAFVGYGAALAFGAAAAVIYFTDPARGSAQRQVACAPGFHGAGVGCALRF
jgi:hypothetical protein